MKKSSTPSKIFSDRLRAAREFRNLNQAELSKRSGLQASAVSHFETGTRKPSFDNLRRLADALEVTTDYLLGRVNEPTAVAGADRLHRHFDRLSTTDRDFAEKMIKALAEKNRSNNEEKK